MKFIKNYWIYILLLIILITVCFFLVSKIINTNNSSINTSNEEQSTKIETNIEIEEPTTKLDKNNDQSNVKNEIEASSINNYNKLYLIITIISILLLIVSLVITYKTYYWRSIFMKEGDIYVTPEKWAAKITELSKAMEKAVINIAENNGSSLNYIQNSMKNIKNDTLKLNKEVDKYSESYNTFQNKISELEEEIKRYKTGYDNKIFKQFIRKFIRINLSVKKLIINNNENKQLSNIHIMLEQAIEESGVNIIIPKIGEDYREANNQIADNPKHIETDDKNNINKIAEVIEEGYELIGTDKNEVIIPAKVAVYILKEKG